MDIVQQMSIRSVVSGFLEVCVLLPYKVIWFLHEGVAYSACGLILVSLNKPL